MCREAKILLIVSALFTLAMGLSNIFVNIFFWKQTKDFIVITIYNLMHYLVTPAAFFGAGIIAKKKNGIWPLRIGLLIYALFFALILLLGNKGVIFIYLLGIVYGFGTGFYWLAFNTLSFDFTHTKNRDTFNGYNGSCAGVAAAVSPITAGYIINAYKGNIGYYLVFAATLTIFLILFLISYSLKCRHCGSKLDFKKSVSRNCDEWSTIRKATALWAFRDVIIVFLVNILIIETTKSELSLGKFALIASLVSSASYVLVQRVVKPPRRKLAIFIGTLGSFIAVLGLALQVNYITLIMYVVLDAFFLPFFIIQLSSSTYNVISRIHEEDMRIEYMINKDLALNAGRIISALILIFLLSAFEGTSMLKFYLVFIGLAPVAAGYVLRKLKGVFEG